ncbi:hypothetical protein B6I21_03190 [candidate division KSB1 bacterium 4572_119]|nr:MAG: hypothetical protein B6I21_03190 [candidate division KSB1 bacterium 4572_119]
MTKNLYRFVLLIILITTLATGCGKIFRKPTLSLDSITIGEIRHRVEQNYLKFKSVKTQAKLSLESPQMSFMASSTIKVKTPDSLIVKLSAGLGFGVGSIFIDKNQFLLYSAFENVVYHANPDSVDIRRFLLVDVKIEDIIQVFSGIHLIKPHERELLKIDEKKYLIIGTNGGYIMKYWVDPKMYVVTGYEMLERDGKTIIEFEYSQFMKSKGVFVPKMIRISQPDKKTRMTIMFSHFKVNADLDKKDFFIKIPDGVERIEL